MRKLFQQKILKPGEVDMKELDKKFFESVVGGYSGIIAGASGLGDNSPGTNAGTIMGSRTSSGGGSSNNNSFTNFKTN